MRKNKMEKVKILLAGIISLNLILAPALCFADGGGIMINEERNNVVMPSGYPNVFQPPAQQVTPNPPLRPPTNILINTFGETNYIVSLMKNLQGFFNLIKTIFEIGTENFKEIVGALNQLFGKDRVTDLFKKNPNELASITKNISQMGLANFNQILIALNEHFGENELKNLFVNQPKEFANIIEGTKIVIDLFGIDKVASMVNKSNGPHKDEFYQLIQTISKMGAREFNQAVEALKNILGSEIAGKIFELSPYTTFCSLIKNISKKSSIIKPLIEALSEEDSDIREAATEALIKIGQPAVEPLVQAMGNPDLYKEAQQVLIKIGGPAVESLIQALNNNNPQIRFSAAYVLGEIGDAQAVMPLIKALRDTDPLVRQQAAVALGNIGDPQAINPLIQALLDSEPFVRDTVGKVLFKIGQIGPLIEALGDNNPDLRQAVEEILVIIGDTQVIDSLKERIKKEEDSIIRGYMQQTLDRLERRVNIRKAIEEEFKIIIEDTTKARFSLSKLEGIYSVLKSMPFELVLGISKIAASLMFNSGEYWPAEKAILLNPYLPDLSSASKASFCQTLFHEIAHFIDDKYFGSAAFKELFDKSQNPEDFAKEYGMRNHLEDFATTIEMHSRDTRKEFLKAISQAQEGKPIYLEKLLFALDVFTKGHPDYTIIYSGVVQVQQLAVGRDADGKITSIAGVSINDLDGLESLFKGDVTAFLYTTSTYR